ncbi:MAG: S1C family serine protease [Massiliimalia sp.]
MDEYKNKEPQDPKVTVQDVPEYGPSSFYGPDPTGGKRPGGHGGLRIFVLILSVILLFLIFVVVGYLGVHKTEKTDTQTSSQLSQQGTESKVQMELNSSPEVSEDSAPESQTQQTGSAELDTEDIATKVQPSVVGLEVLFQGTDGTVSSSGGSGIVLSSDGYIVTNAHVVVDEQTQKTANKIDVHLDNGEVYDGSIVGTDTKTDLAVVKINAQNLVPAEFGNSQSLRVGERVIAIGNPGGLTLASTLTQGVVSGLNRVISNSSTEPIHYIQTDAAINPGNSGGALVNRYGQVIGINTIKIVSEEYEGIGFAIPVHEAKPIVDSIIENGYVSGRVKLGITYTPITESKAELLKIPEGIRVVQVEPSSDAAKQGLQKGDIITKIDGKPVLEGENLSNVLTSKTPGDTVELSVYRIENGKEVNLTLTVTLQEDLSGQAAS